MLLTGLPSHADLVDLFPAQAVTSRQLAPRLQQDIAKALADYHPDAVADYLQVRGQLQCEWPASAITCC